MSMLGTLAKVAIGVAIAKGASSVLQGAQGAGQTVPSSGGGSVFGDVFSPKPQSAGTGLEEMLGDALSGGARSRTTTQPGSAPASQSGGGLGGLLESLVQGSAQGSGQGSGQPQSGGLNDLLQGQGGLGELLGGLLGGAMQGQPQAAPTPSQPGGSFGDLLNDALSGRQEPRIQPTPHQDAAAALMLRAMIMAAKSDGKIDEKERQKLLGSLGDVSAQERDFVNAELQAPLDLAGLIRQVPRGLEQQVYAMSVMAIDLDSQAEAQYLDTLAKGMKIDPQTANAIHSKMGVPHLYR